MVLDDILLVVDEVTSPLYVSLVVVWHQSAGRIQQRDEDAVCQHLRDVDNPELAVLDLVLVNAQHPEQGVPFDEEGAMYWAQPLEGINPGMDAFLCAYEQVNV